MYECIIIIDKIICLLTKIEITQIEQENIIYVHGKMTIYTIYYVTSDNGKLMFA